MAHGSDAAKNRAFRDCWLSARVGRIIRYPVTETEDSPLAKPNYQFEKRQKELAKKKKKEEKRLRKLADTTPEPQANPETPAATPPVEGSTA